MDAEQKVNKAEQLINTPVRWPVAAIAIALMCSLALSATVQSIYATFAESTRTNVVNESQLAAALVGAKQSVKVAAEPLVGASKESDRIIVKYKDATKLPSGLSVAAERANLEKAQGLVKVLTISGINAEVYQVNAEDTAQEVVDRLLVTKKDIIEYAEVDMLVPPVYTPNDPNLSSAWHITKVSAPTAWDLSEGEGVVIAIADTGVDCNHPDLAQSCVSGWNTASNNADTTDINGHGTMVAGTAAEIGDNAVGSAGIAYKAKIMPLRVTDSADGYAYFSAIANAFTWAADRGAKVAQASYSACGSASVLSAGAYLRAKGGVATISAGNSGADGGFAPANDLVCVSATETNDVRTSWSSFGQYVDVAAPGAGIYTTARGGGYANVSGTSFSGPLTTGVYALIFAANPALTPNQADNILFSTADDLGEPGWDMYYGHGRVNAAKAVAAAYATIGTRDTVAPSVPANLRTTSVTFNSVSFAWNAATDDNAGVAQYDVYEGSTKIASVSGTSFTHSGRSPLTAYTYTVRAVDGAGNVSAASTPLSVTTPDTAFGISSYSVPQKTNTSATIAAVLTKPGSVTVKYGVTSSNLNLAVSSTASSTVSHTVALSGLSAGTTYYYQVIATDGSATVVSPVSSFKTNKGGGKPRR